MLLQYSCLENPMDGGAWWAAVHGVAKSRTWLSYFTFTFHFHALEKEMATHSSVLAWRIPGAGEPGGLPSMGSHRVGHNWSYLAVGAVCDGQKVNLGGRGDRYSFFPIYFPVLSYKYTRSMVESVMHFISVFLDWKESHGVTVWIL